MIVNMTYLDDFSGLMNPTENQNTQCKENYMVWKMYLL